MPTKAKRKPNPERRTLIPLPLGRREWILVISSWFVASLMLIIVGQTKYLLSRENILRYNEGDIVAENFILENELTFLDKQATEKAINLNRSLVPPVYVVRGEISEAVLENFDRFASYFTAALSNRGSEKAASELRSEFPGISGIIDRESPRSIGRITELLDITRDVLQSLQLGGIFRLDPRDGGAASGIVEVVYSNVAPDRRVSLIRNAVTTRENINDRSRAVDEVLLLENDDIEFVTALVNFFSEPNTYLSAELSDRNRDEAEAATEPVRVTVPAGTRLLTRGTVVSAQQYRVLEALRDRRTQGYHSFVDPFVFMAIIFVLGLVAARSFDIRFRNDKTLWLYVVLSGSYVLVSSLFVSFAQFTGPLTVSVVLPTALFTLLLAQLLQDRRLAVLSSVLMALLVFFLTGENSHDFLVTLASGLGGTLAVRRRETRMGLLRAGPRLALVLSGFILLSGILVGIQFRTALIMSVGGVVNGLVTGILSVAFLPLLEHVLNTATTFRLIELSDQNVPVLRRMRLQAPGTYIHSQNVAHLAEAACDAIGADGLLARVGAYYHDIGKVDQAHFFVENQTGENKHDELKPTLSAAVIKSHVKIGMEKGRDLRLPDEVLAIIEQHHGTSVIRYFYDRAVKEKGAESTSPEDFSYGGPKPLSREAALVMLADNAEAATRTLKKPTTAKLEKYVWDLIMDRFRSGELNECDLTLRDLEVVKETFVHVLTGHFHSRIEYPKNEEDSK